MPVPGIFSTREFSEQMSMLRDMLCGSVETSALIEELGLFKDPRRLETYLVMTKEVLDVLFCRILGTEKTTLERDVGIALH